MSEIAKAVSVTKGTLYYHISSKEELLYRSMVRAITRSCALLSQIVETNLNAREKLRRAMLHHIEYTVKHKAELSILIEDFKHLSKKYAASVSDEMRRYEMLFQQIIDEGVSSGEFNEVNSKIAAYGILGMCNWIYRWLSDKGTTTTEQVASLFCDMILIGIEKK